MMFSLSTYKFDSTKNYWSLVQGGLMRPSIRGIRPSIDIITYNVCVPPDYFEERAAHILNLIQGADIICLQEVTYRFLYRTEWVRKDYVIADSIVGGCGVLMISKFPIPFTSVFLTSSQGMSFIFGDVYINDKKLRIGTVQLESFQSNESVRCKQIVQISSKYKNVVINISTSIFTGDFNIGGDSKEATRVLEKKMHKTVPYFCDAWLQMHPDKPGYTYDSELNEMIVSEKTLEMIGMESFEVGNQIFIHPSDHFGLRATLTWIDPVLKQISKFAFRNVRTRKEW